ncbi:MAG TPA: CesT family type III secretion system chaperone [Geminicoccaceae bacterium]|nr:CesT family type III secretion system chaperone [Geminicoccaceae bacterium]
MQPDTLLGELAKKLGAGTLAPDGEGRVRLDFADGLVVDLYFPARGQMYAEALLERLPERPAEAEAAMRKALRRALAALRDRQEALALDRAGNGLVIWRRFMIDEASFAELETDLADFLDEVDAWRNAAEPPRQVGPMTMMLFP